MCNGFAVERLCGQLIVGGYLGEAPPSCFLDAIDRGHRGGAILFKRNLPSVEAAWEACREIAARAPSEAPVWLCLDEEGGRVRRLPAPFLKLPAMLKLSALGDASLVQRAATIAGEQLRALGFNLNLAPVLDLNTNPENPVIGDRAFGSDPVEASRMALAYLSGLRDAGVVACGKHFPGHGDTCVDSHLGLPVVSWGRARLDAVELVPFRSAIAAGIECIMSAHIVCEAIDALAPATLSKTIATGILRQQLGFEGVLLSDDLEMKAIAAQRELGQAAVDAIKAGCDAVLVCSRQELQEAVHAALVREAQGDPQFLARCRQAAQRTLKVRRRHPASPCPDARSSLGILNSAQALTLQAELEARLG